MKKLLFFAILAILATTFAGCDKNDDEFGYEKSQIYGTWRVTHVDLGEGYVNVVGTIYEQTFEPTYITFGSDGTFSTYGYFGSASGKYKTSGKKTIITYYTGGEEIFRYDIVSLSGNVAEAQMYEKNNPSDKFKMKVERQ